MFVLWMGCSGGTRETTAPPAPVPDLTPSPSVSIEAELDRCLAADPSSEANVRCVRDAVQAWKVRLDEAGKQLLDAATDAQDPLVVRVRETWDALVTVDAALGASVRQKRAAPPLDAAFEELNGTRDAVLRLERFAAASRQEPEPPELSEHPIDLELETCLRRPDGKDGCGTVAIAAWDAEVGRRQSAIAGLLGSTEVLERAQAAWGAYRAAVDPLAAALLTDPTLAARERAALVRRRAEVLGAWIDQLRTVEP